MSYHKYPQNDPRHPTAKAVSRLYDLIALFRVEARQTDDLRAQALFNTGAEVLAGLVRAYRDYEHDMTDAERNQPPDNAKQP